MAAALWIRSTRYASSPQGSSISESQSVVYFESVALAEAAAVKIRDVDKGVCLVVLDGALPHIPSVKPVSRGRRSLPEVEE